MDIWYAKISGTNDKNRLLEVIFYAGFVVSIVVVSHFLNFAKDEKRSNDRKNATEKRIRKNVGNGRRMLADHKSANKKWTLLAKVWQPTSLMTKKR